VRTWHVEPRRTITARIVASVVAGVLVASACGTSAPGGSPAATATSAPSTVAGSPPTASSPIKVGVITPLTGFGAAFGQKLLHGAEFALKERGGSVGDRQVTLISEDDTCAPENAVSAANKLVSEGVAAVVGPPCSAAAAAAGPILSSASIPYLIGAYAPQLTERGDPFVFRPTPNDRFLLRAVVSMLEDAGFADKVALARDSSGYGSAAAEVLAEVLQAQGHPSPVVDSVFDLGATDFTGQVQAIQRAAPEALVILSFEAETGLLVRQARQLGLDTPVFEIYATPPFSEPAGEAAEGVRFAVRSLPQDPLTKAFSDEFQAEFSVPTDGAEPAYMAMLAIMDSLERAGPDATGAALRDSLRQTDLDTKAGHVSFDANGDLKAPRVLLGAFKDGEPVLERAVTPADLP
jgi:branched-chain amino acid transport system substrate-binding protein